jgi:hypothetical protein
LIQAGLGLSEALLERRFARRVLLGGSFFSDSICAGALVNCEVW